jgi:hypothetical protein
MQITVTFSPLNVKRSFASSVTLVAFVWLWLFLAGSQPKNALVNPPPLKKNPIKKISFSFWQKKATTGYGNMANLT